MAEWKLYYGDGSTFSSVDGAPWQAPGLDVQVIVLSGGDIGPGSLHSKDYYLYHAERGWFGCDLFGLIDQLTHDYHGSIRAVKAGREIDSETFRAILARATYEAFP